MNIRKSLSAPKTYLEQINHLHLKYLQNNRLYKAKQDGVSFASICFDSKRFSKLLARTIVAGKYQAKPANTHVVTINNKNRKIYIFSLTDTIVHSVVSVVINEAMTPYFSPCLYSYRKGVCWSDALADFSSYVRKHRRNCKDPTQRGLYVLRRDITKYTDSIPVNDCSRIWSILRMVLNMESSYSKRDKTYWELIKNVIRPEIISEKGFLFSNTLGVPTGSPISTTLFNLYLIPMDQELSEIPGAFYARYSDDFLFAHSDPNVVQKASQLIDKYLRDLGLRSNKTKNDDLFFNGAGRTSSLWADTRGTTYVTFLGCNVSFEGTVSLNGEKVKQLYKDISKRARRTLNALDSNKLETAGPIICAVVNDALNPESPCHQQSSQALRSVVTCRRQLKDIDYNIARNIAQILSGVRGARAFRQVRYRTIREHWGLKSLLHIRNQMQ